MWHGGYQIAEVGEMMGGGVGENKMGGDVERGGGG